MIAIFGLICDSNIGDRILNESTLYLCKKTDQKSDFQVFDLKGRDIRMSPIVFFLKGIRHFERRILKKQKTTFIDFLLFNLYLRRGVCNAEKIIFGGGGVIEWEHYSCDIYINRIISFAEKYNIPVYFSAVGFNGAFNENSARCLELQKAINSGCVKGVSVRENLKEAQEKWFYKKNVSLVCDPAVWSADAYSVQKKESETIGVGVIRPNIFKEFGFDVSENDVIQFYIRFLEILNRKNIKWQIFTNGAMPDYEFAIQILEKLNLICEEEFLYSIPKSGKEFLECLSNYKVILCARMHAAICSYSLGIPSVALYWNPKQKFFYKNIGYEKRCCDINEMSAEDIYDALKNAMEEGLKKTECSKFKNKISNSLEKFLSMQSFFGGN